MLGLWVSSPFPIKSSYMFHHGLGLSICGARCFWRCARSVRIVYGRNVIGWSAAAFCSLCPYDVRSGDDHRSLFQTATLVIGAMLHWFTIVCCLFLRHCCIFFYAISDLSLLIINNVVLCVFCDSVLSFFVCAQCGIEKGCLVTPPGRAAQSRSSPQGLTIKVFSLQGTF